MRSRYKVLSAITFARVLSEVIAESLSGCAQWADIAKRLDVASDWAKAQAKLQAPDSE